MTRPVDPAKFEAFTGHPPGTVACDFHDPERAGGRHDPECVACIEADCYCPHGHLGFRHFWGAHPGDGCWRPHEPWDGTGPQS